MQANNKTPKYNPLKDGSFWAAFVLGGGPWIPVLAFSGLFFEPPVLISTVFLIGWTGWVIFKKGRKNSLLVGFFVAMILAVIAAYPAIKIQENKFDAELESITQDYMEKYMEEIRAERLENQ